MKPFDPNAPTLSRQNLLVMQAYAVRAAAAKASDDTENPGWLERIDSHPELAPDELTQVHGQLIALGYLKFEISGRSVGLKYQVSDTGRHAMEKTIAFQNAEAGSSAELDDAQDAVCEPSDFSEAA